MDDTSAVEPTARIGPPPSREERTRRIGAAPVVQASGYFVPFQGRYQAMPVLRLDADLLVYRAENGRLIAELMEHARRHGVDLQGLNERQDTPEVQQLLHRLLIAKAADPTGPIYQELAREGLQTDPLLITADGVLINGNRRLAAMRELRQRDPQRYAPFAQVNAAVLPQDASAAEIESIEAALQMAPETKLGYGWVNRRMKMRFQRQGMGLAAEDLVAAYRLEDAAQIDRELAELKLAEDYLTNFANTPGAYSSIEDAEALFVGLAERLGLLPGELRSVWRLAGFTLIHGRKALGAAMDRHFPFAAPAPEHLPTWTLRRFAEERDLVEPQNGPSSASVLDGPVREDLEAIFADALLSDQLAPELFNLMERLRADFQLERQPQRVLKLLQRVRQSVDESPRGAINEKQLRRMRSELYAIQLQISELLGDDGGEPAAPASEPEPQRGLAGRLARALNPH